MQEVVEPGVFVPPVLQLGFETYIADPFHSVVDFFSKGVALFEQSCFVHGVGANGLGEVCRDGMEIVEVDGGVTLELATDNGVIWPLDLDEVGDLLGPIFFGNF